MAAALRAPLAPALAAKPVSASSPSPGTPGSVISREWIIPPRPKPGRKPATDTPPTKRKAQNRAAQRAFRERRAARVNELEEQMKAMEDEHEVEIAAFKGQVGNLSREVDQCRIELNWWRDRCRTLEKEASENNAKELLTRDLQTSRPETENIYADSVPLPPRNLARNPPSTARLDEVQNNPMESGNGMENIPMGCDSCSSTRCQCVEDAFVMSGIEEQEMLSHSSEPQDHSRLVGHPEPEIKTEPDDMEIDFTSRSVAMQPAVDTTGVAMLASPAVDPCGFCQDDTPCICAEMVCQEEQAQPRRHSFEKNRLAPIQSFSQFTPPPSEGDVRSEVTLPSIINATNSCADGPGTCAQCRGDPRSTLFCKSLAASRPTTAHASGYSGGHGTDGGYQSCHPSSPRRTGPNTIPVTTPESLTLSCADAFTTLSRHPNFSRATDDIGSWVPKLHALPHIRGLMPVELTESRAAMEVEAASVMGVLRYFDRRFADK